MDKLIPLKNGLFTDFRANQVKDDIVKVLQNMNMVNDKYKLDVEFLTYLVNLIEYMVVKRDKINKKELAFNILRECFGASEEDILIIGKNIDYLHSNKIIKKVSYYKLFKATMSEFFSAKKK
jgi:hypothetical protein